MEYFIECPEKIESGGPELAHQMCNKLNELGYDSKMYYIKSDTIEPQNVSASAKYLKYNTEHTLSREEVEKESSVLVFNEGGTGLIPYFNRCHKVLWWMSVDNYILNTQEKDIDIIRSQIEIHLVQSKYAYEYVKNTLGICQDRIMYVSDYIGDMYMTYIPEMDRNNIALFNPKKGLNDIMPLIEKTSSWLKWIPLVNLTERDMVAYMHISKIYVDFGNHPGKDRIPREAAICGCAVITNKNGSAAYYEDIPIKEKYKIADTNNLIDIEDLLHYICDNYTEVQKDFDEYRSFIRGEKSQFNIDISRFADRFSNCDR